MRRLSKRARLLLALAMCFAVTASAAGLLLSLNGGSRAQAAAAPAAPSGPQPGSTQARADLGHMQALLNGGSVSAQAALLVPPMTFASGSGPIVPAGKTVTILPGTLRPHGRFGTVRASVSDGTAVTLDLYSVQGHWRLYDVVTGTAQTTAKVTQPGPARAQLMSDVGNGNTCPTWQEIGMRVPVILVHGFGESASNWSDGGTASMFARVDSIQGVWTYAFNYSQTDHAWVDNQANGPALANYIHCVAQASAEAGGPGKVAIVAFSMGGLLTRYAATTGGRAVDIGMVITIGTPNTGSFEANVGAVAHAVVCATNPQSSFCTQWTALNGMSVFGPEIRDLGKLPPSIPLHAIAGDETYVYKIWNALGAIPLFGDGIVPTGSALDKPPGWMNDTFDTVRNPLVPGDVSAWHLALKSNPQVQQKVHDYIYAYVQAHQPRAPAPVATPSPALGGDAYWLAGGGLWHVHGATLQISQGPSGLIGAETWNDGAQIIIGHAQLTFVSQPDGSLVGTYTGPTTHTYNGPANGMQLPSGEPQQGQDITLVPVAPGLAKTLYDSNSPAMFIGGNPYLCGPGLAVANPSQYCGA